jgi:hypothetical protein
MTQIEPGRTGRRHPRGSNPGARAAPVRVGPTIRALPIKEFCEVYGVSATSVWRAIAAGRLKTITISDKPHGKRLILLSSVEEQAS